MIVLAWRDPIVTMQHLLKMFNSNIMFRLTLLTLLLLYLTSAPTQLVASSESKTRIAELTGKWQGTFHQNSHEHSETVPMVLTVEHVTNQEFSGTINWPENKCKTAIHGNLEGKTLKFTETNYIEGDDVVLDGLYVGKFSGSKKLTGNWMDPKHTIYPKGPNYGVSGGSFELSKSPPED